MYKAALMSMSKNDSFLDNVQDLPGLSLASLGLSDVSEASTGSKDSGKVVAIAVSTTLVCLCVLAVAGYVMYTRSPTRAVSPSSSTTTNLIEVSPCDSPAPSAPSSAGVRVVQSRATWMTETTPAPENKESNAWKELIGIFENGKVIV